MNQNEKARLAASMMASTPRLAQPVISEEEMNSFPCTITKEILPVEGYEDVTVYLTVPENKKEKAPIIVNYHGGGFIRGRSDRDELFCRRLACTFGAVVVDVDYSLAPDYPFPTAVYQARSAAVWAKNHAENLGCDPEKLIMSGQSAGGNLVANVLMEEVDETVVKPLCALISYAPLDLRTDPGEKFHPERDMPVERARNYNALYCLPENAGDVRVSPVLAPTERLVAFPPTLVISAGDDMLAAENETFAANLVKAGVTVTAKRYHGCVHGFFINRMDAWEEGIAQIHTFFTHALNGTLC